MVSEEEFWEWDSVSDFLMQKRKPAEVECALRRMNWYYITPSRLVLPADKEVLDRALGLLAKYCKQSDESNQYPWDVQPPFNLLNTDCDPGLCRFRWAPDSPPNFDYPDEIIYKPKSRKIEFKAENPWTTPNDDDPPPAQDWYIPARFFAREIIRENPNLLKNRNLLAKRVADLLPKVGVFKRGGKLPLDPGTVLKAFTNVKFG